MCSIPAAKLIELSAIIEIHDIRSPGFNRACRSTCRSPVVLLNHFNQRLIVCLRCPPCVRDLSCISWTNVRGRALLGVPFGPPRLPFCIWVRLVEFSRLLNVERAYSRRPPSSGCTSGDLPGHRHAGGCRARSHYPLLAPRQSACESPCSFLARCISMIECRVCPLVAESYDPP